MRSKQHYKEQWSKALRELAAVRQREQVGMIGRDVLSEHEGDHVLNVVAIVSLILITTGSSS